MIHLPVQHLLNEKQDNPNGVILLFYEEFHTPRSFTDSNLPIIIINTDGGAEIPDDPRIRAGNENYMEGRGVREISFR